MKQRGSYVKIRKITVRARLKIHSRNLHAPLRDIFVPNSVAVAHYAAFIWAKSPTKCDAQLTENNFQIRTRKKITDFIRTIKPEEETMAVSYTHLDVYKRQACRLPPSITAN